MWTWVSFLAGAVLSALVAGFWLWRWSVKWAHRQVIRQRKLLERTRRAEKLAEMGILAGHLAHEIRNPLSIIKVNMQLLYEDIEAQSKLAQSQCQDNAQLEQLQRKYNRQLRKIKTVTNETDRLAGTLTDFMKYAGRIELHLARYDINEILDDLIDFYEPQAVSSGIQIRRNLSKKPVWCKVDADLLKQALLNLFINATQAMKDGGELIIRSGSEVNQARIEVIDTGPGISEQNQAKIFEPYFTSRKGGSGMGLPMCRRIVEEHNGHIELYSDEGKGSNFTIVLPLTE